MKIERRPIEEIREVPDHSYITIVGFYSPISGFVNHGKDGLQIPYRKEPLPYDSILRHDGELFFYLFTAQETEQCPS